MNTNDVFSLAYRNYYRLTFNQYKHCWDVILFNTGASCVCLCVHMHILVYFYTSTWTLLWLFMCSSKDNVGVCHLPFLETRLLTEPVISWAGQAGWPVSLSESMCLCLPVPEITNALHPCLSFLCGFWGFNLNLCALSVEPSPHPTPYISNLSSKLWYFKGSECDIRF